MGDKDKEDDLPQPGLEELEGNGDDGGDDPTGGPGNVSVDEPTEPALRRDADDDDSWSDPSEEQVADREADSDKG